MLAIFHPDKSFFFENVTISERVAQKLLSISKDYYNYTRKFY